MNKCIYNREHWALIWLECFIVTGRWTKIIFSSSYHRAARNGSSRGSDEEALARCDRRISTRISSGFNVGDESETLPSGDPIPSSAIHRRTAHRGIWFGNIPQTPSPLPWSSGHFKTSRPWEIINFTRWCIPHSSVLIRPGPFILNGGSWNWFILYIWCSLLINKMQKWNVRYLLIKCKNNLYTQEKTIGLYKTNDILPTTINENPIEGRTFLSHLSSLSPASIRWKIKRKFLHADSNFPARIATFQSSPDWRRASGARAARLCGFSLRGFSTQRLATSRSRLLQPSCRPRPGQQVNRARVRDWLEITVTTDKTTHFYYHHHYNIIIKIL